MRFENFDVTACTLCPRRCMADRTSGVGVCGGGDTPRIARAALHMWEEPCISGERGSGTVFFSGCPLGCVFCQNYDISLRRGGTEITVERLADEFRRLESIGAHNINLVTPTHFAPWIARALELAKPAIPVVYNTGGYESVETLRELDGLIDIYMPDFKYASGELAAKFSGARDYFERACEAIREMYRQTGGCVFGEDDMLLRGVIVRHLVLPGHSDDSIRVFGALAELLPPEDILVGVMSQYTPPAEYGRDDSDLPSELRRRIYEEEYDAVCECVAELGFNGFAQDLDSSSAAYTPDWDFKA